MAATTKKVYPPMTGANPHYQWVAEVRSHGWLVAYKYFNDERNAKAWLKAWKGIKMDKAAAKFFAEAVKRHAMK